MNDREVHDSLMSRRCKLAADLCNALTGLGALTAWGCGGNVDAATGEAKTTGPIESYNPSSNIGTIAFGGVQRLANDSTVITFSSNGVIHEIDVNKTLLRELVIGDPIGYSVRRASLYGPPPHLQPPDGGP